MKVCAKCGTWCDEDETVCLSCGSTELIYKCPKCSAVFDGDHCKLCGYTAKNVLSDKPSKQEVDKLLGKEKKHSTLPFILSLIGLITTFLFPLSIAGVILSIIELRKGNASKEIIASLAMGTLNILVFIIFCAVYGPFLMS